MWTTSASSRSEFERRGFFGCAERVGCKFFLHVKENGFFKKIAGIFLRNEAER